MAMLFSPSAARSIEARSERPMSRLISWVRPPMRPFTDSRSLRVWVARGSIEYSAVTQPRPEPFRQRGTPSVTLAAHSTRVRPNSTSTEPSAWWSQLRVMVTGRSWSAARPSGRVTHRRVMARGWATSRRGYRRSPAPGPTQRLRAPGNGTWPRCDPEGRNVIVIPHAIGTARRPHRRGARGGGPDRRLRRLRAGGGRRAPPRVRPARHRRAGHHRDGGGQRRRPARAAGPAAPPGRPLAAPARPPRPRPRPRPAGLRPAVRERPGARRPASAGHVATDLPGGHQHRQPSTAGAVLLPPRLNRAGPRRGSLHSEMSAGHGRMPAMTQTASGVDTATVRPSPGGLGPDFTLPQSDGHPVSLWAFRRPRVIVDL